jgi:hypothetical protein
MSRSRKHTPIAGMTCAESEKSFKRAEHQRERAQVRQTLRTTADETSIVSSKTFGNPWAGPKDGKGYMRDVTAIAEHSAGLKRQTDAKRLHRELHKLLGK